MNKPIDISRTVLHTSRLVLRPWRQADLEDFYAYASVDGVGQMAGWLPHQNRQTTQAILDNFIAGKKTFALQYGSNVIGSLGVERYDEAACPELADKQGRAIGYVLSKAYWGQGLMPEAVRAVLGYLFDTEGLDFVIISHFLWNTQSRRVIEKCGLHPYRETVHETHFGTCEPTLEHIVFRSEWENA